MHPARIKAQPSQLDFAAQMKTQSGGVNFDRPGVIKNNIRCPALAMLRILRHRMARGPKSFVKRSRTITGSHRKPLPSEFRTHLLQQQGQGHCTLRYPLSRVSHRRIAIAFRLIEVR